MTDRHKEIEEIVDRETRAWNTQDADLLLSVLHSDMVWPWPPRADAHDPMEWVIVWGRYDAEPPGNPSVFSESRDPRDPRPVVPERRICVPALGVLSATVRRRHTPTSH